MLKRHTAPKSTAEDAGGPRGYPRGAAPAALRTEPDSSAHTAPPPSPPAPPALPWLLAPTWAPHLPAAGKREGRRSQTRAAATNAKHDFLCAGKSRSAQSSTTAEHTGSAPRGRTREGLGAGPPLWIDSRPGQWEDRIRLPPPAREGRYCRPAVEGEGVSMTSRAAPRGQVGRAALRRCGDGERDRGAKSGLSPAAGQSRAYCAPRGWGTELIPLRLWGGLRAEGLAAASAVLLPRSAEEKRGTGSAAAGWVSPTRTAVLPWALP